MIITKVMINEARKTIKHNNIMIDLAKFILTSITKEVKEKEQIDVHNIRHLLDIQTELITTFDDSIASKRLSKEQIEERINVLEILQKMTKSLFDDAFDNLNKRLNEFKSNYDEDLSRLTKEELIDLVKTLEKEQNK